MYTLLAEIMEPVFHYPKRVISIGRPQKKSSLQPEPSPLNSTCATASVNSSFLSVHHFIINNHFLLQYGINHGFILTPILQPNASNIIGRESCFLPHDEIFTTDVCQLLIPVEELIQWLFSEYYKTFVELISLRGFRNQQASNYFCFVFYLRHPLTYCVILLKSFSINDTRASLRKLPIVAIL